MIFAVIHYSELCVAARVASAGTIAPPGDDRLRWGWNFLEAKAFALLGSYFIVLCPRPIQSRLLLRWQPRYLRGGTSDLQQGSWGASDTYA
jgi:hypothetical protein